MANRTTISSRSKIAQLNGITGKNLPEPANSTRVPLQSLSTMRAVTTTSSVANASAMMPRTAIKKPMSTLNATTRPRPPATEMRPKSSSIATTIRRPPIRNHQISSALTTTTQVTNRTIPETNQIRKGIAKFSNPMECQRQFQALTSQIQQLENTIKDRDKTVGGLENQLKEAISKGVGYATVVQYLAGKLKLDSPNDLTMECEQLKSRVDLLTEQESNFENKLENLINDYKNHLQVELDLRNKLEDELTETKKAHLEFIERLKETHKNKLLDLNSEHSEIKGILEERIQNLETELKINIRDLSELRKEHEILVNDFNKLEESLTKDKDARVKYLQEKINQLQKDVDSLNSVLEMRTEKMHSLEKDSLLLIEAQSDLKVHQDTIKTLNQQLESLNAALEKKREQFDNLMVENEKLRQDLKKERNERRRMTMKSEQLEFVLNESCASESNMVFSQNGVRDVDNDQII